ncbi:(2Fe-2S)-binding protein [Paenibacillus sp. P96]|uniref:(2Fe-2S)-binding protein n=1 Tax=Paenibacillus zeirhizosphaerae TaxID=2987519 RepID=A0ABT9FKX5_9BACL|nr:(2Fe-2S)-binding protein [Paenibacillus sp. P96]MDP4095388.1 (2Fe-2S)-binding protein [Paenibacillus sp. P96]
MRGIRIVNHPILGPQPERCQVSFMFDGRPMQGLAGEPLAAALLASSVRLLRKHEESGTPRGMYCAIGHCNECRLTVHSLGTVRSCLTRLEEGMIVETGRQLSNEITGRMVT